MKSKWLKQFICILLVVVFVIQLIPVYALPLDGKEGAEATDEAPEIVADLESKNISDATVIGEVEELRDESVKQFKMSDGSYVAIEYVEPVHHCDDNGNWYDLDNTLNEKCIDGKNTYIATVGNITKRFSSNLETNGEIFEIEYKDYSVSMAISDYSNDADINRDVTVDSEDECSDDESITSYSVAAVVDNPPDNKDGENYIGKKANELSLPTKYTSNVTYKNVYNGADLMYYNYGYDIKESIVLYEKQNEYIYSFILHLNNLKPLIGESGGILLQNDSGETIFDIPAPYMCDSAGNVSYDAHYKIEEAENGFILMIEADSDWMNSPDRVYPITIDPTISYHAKRTNVKVSYICDGYPDTTGSRAAGVRCGKYDSIGVCHMCVQVENKPVLPKNCVIIDSQISVAHLGLFGSTGGMGTGSGGSVLVDAYKLNSTFTNFENLTWNQVYGSNGCSIGATILDYKKLDESTLNSYVDWNVTSEVVKWYSTSDAKIAFAFVPEDADTLRYFANMVGHEWNNISPYFLVNYRNTVGVEDYYTYRTASSARAGLVYISDFTSQLTLINEDVSLSTNAVSTGISHVYNTAYADEYFTSGSDGIHTCDFSDMIVGKGWKLSIQQTVVPITLSEQQYLVYNDADGTEHYFIKTGTNTFEDEDGLNLKIVKSTSNGNTIYTLTDKDAYNTLEFFNGYLISSTDSNGNVTYIAYNYYSDIFPSNPASNNSWKPTNNSSTYRITRVFMVPSGGNALRVATLEYNTNQNDADYNRLISITDSSNRTTSYSYDNDINSNKFGTLISICYPDGVEADYTYNDNSYVSRIYDSEYQYGLDFTYWDNHHGGYLINKVSEFEREYSEDGTTVIEDVPGVVFHGYNETYQRKAYRYYGSDNIDDTTTSDGRNNDTIVNYIFDYVGRTICVYQMDGNREKVIGASTAAYTTNSGTQDTNNRLLGTGALGIMNSGICADCGFESASLALSSSTRDINSDAPAPVSLIQASSTMDNRVHSGKYALHFHSLSTYEQSEGYISATLTSGKTYTISCYVSNYFIDTWPENAGGRIVVKGAGNEDVVCSSLITTRTSPNIERGWEKISATVYLDGNGSSDQYYVGIQTTGFAGDYYVDDFKIEESLMDFSGENYSDEEQLILSGQDATSTNLLVNGNFDCDKSNWRGTGGTFTNSSDTKFGNGAIIMNGNPTEYKNICQTVMIYDSQPGTYILSGWGKGTPVGSSEETFTGSNPFFGMLAAVVYGETQDDLSGEEWHFVPFNKDYTDWQFSSGVIVPKRNEPVYCIRVYLIYAYNANMAFFDNISLIREPVQTYSYDSEGNVISAKDGDAKKTVDYYSGTSLIHNYTTSADVNYELTYYDNTHNVKDIISDGITKTYSYNATGNTTKVVTKDENNKSLILSNTYSNNMLNSSTDENGITTNYTYTANNYLLRKTINANGVPQLYSYNSLNDRIVSTHIEHVGIQYFDYENGFTSSISRKSFDDASTSTGEHWQTYNIGRDGFGNITSVSVDSSTHGSVSDADPIMISKNEYDPVKSALLKRVYYTFDTHSPRYVDLNYDSFDRLTSEEYTDGTTYHYIYSADGALSGRYASNASNNVSSGYSYEYDSLGRLIRSEETTPYYDEQSNELTLKAVQRTETTYDEADRITSQSWFNAGGTTTQAYEYYDENSLLNVLRIYLPDNAYIPNSTDPGLNAPDITITNQYNNLHQLTRKTVNNLFYRAFAYRNITTNQTTNQVRFMNYRLTNGDRIWGRQYQYDSLGNICAVLDSQRLSQNDPYTTYLTYTYDNQNQLKTATFYDEGGDSTTYTYNYDTAGNILSKENGEETLHTWSYDNGEWADLLTSFDGHQILYEGQTTVNDSIVSGNPISYYDGTEWRFTWAKDRLLVTAYDVDNIISINYTYDMDGIRTSKTVGDTTYNYNTLNGLVIRQEWDGNSVDFIYDDVGQPFAMIYTTDGNESRTYYYVLDFSGDVVALMDDTATIVATYEYDPWGAVTVCDEDGVQVDSDDFIGNINPLRYRGYYYDEETGFYYLRSRYYDPAICRFINADCFATTDSLNLLASNMFAYCENNPIIASDPTGLYRFIDGWTPPGNTQTKKTTPTDDERALTFIKSLFSAIKIEVGIGVGFGGNVEVLGAEADIKYGHNYLEFCLDNGEFDVRSSDKVSAMLNIPIFSAGYEKANYGDAFEMDIDEIDTGHWGVQSKLSIGAGGSLYIGWLGLSVDVDFDMVEFFEYISENW